MNIVAFYIAAAITIISTLLVITRKNAVHALLYLAVSLIAVAVLFYDMGAPFIAALEVIIYAGAIIVLFIFVVMMLNLGKQATIAEGKLLRPDMWIGPTVLAAILFGEVAYLLTRGKTAIPAAHIISPKTVGLVLYGPYLIGVELSSMLLLGALVGAYHLGWHRRPKPETRDVSRNYATRINAVGDTVRTGSDRPAGAA
ncbi:MAG TPA: NADH-quinone oxidoreductase subunit J [Candidatus Angelobacter sp.]|jgi:NADH-quinone oxidoreductase subunit J|nr:NADH-quinone oxidoreductase subunit J [Candidatus Angelobacter sp.]